MTQPRAAASPDRYLSYTERLSEHHAVMLAVALDGTAHADTTYSRPGMPLRALGGYHAALGHDDPDVVALFRGVPGVRKGVASRPPWHPRMGRPRSTLVVHEGDREEPLVADHDATLTPDEERFRETVARILRKLSATPVAAYHVAARLGASEAKRGDELAVTLTFTNPGKAPAEVPTPALAGKPPWQLLRLNLWRPAKGPGGEQGFELELAIDLHGEFLADGRKVLQPTPALLALSPGGSLTVTTRFKIPRVAPGAYQVEAVLATAPADEPPPGPQIHGEFHADPVPLVVRRSGLF